MIHIKHFKDTEFRGKLPYLAVGLLQKLDNFREILGYPVLISPADGAMLRYDKPKSQHTYGRAIDVMFPEGPDLMTAFVTAIKTGFTGIGAYSVWHPYYGLHLDIRPGVNPAKPDTWGWTGSWYNGKRLYCTAQQAIAHSEVVYNGKRAKKRTNTSKNITG